ncbi:MAG TPA: LptA/OstA family protein, partial [Acidobacteriota bacterium]|nr:LptA/OstA family protein [Acidobacteriota bacterium]
SQESTGRATPFGKTKSPVFLTAQQARVNTQTGKATYQGEARAWQDDNFIRGDVIELFQTEKRMTATGHVSSALYQMERTNPKGQKQVIPIFGSSEFFSYNDSKRQARYERNSRLIQGEDTLSADSTDIYLAATTNQVEHLIAQGKVVLTQPQRRGTGDQAEYTASDDKFVLVGNMARVEDSAQGTTTGPRLTFLRSDGSVLATDQRQTQRIRTTHKISK